MNFTLFNRYLLVTGKPPRRVTTQITADPLIDYSMIFNHASHMRMIQKRKTEDPPVNASSQYRENDLPVDTSAEHRPFVKLLNLVASTLGKIQGDRR